MKFIRESEAPKEHFEAPYKRTIAHIVAPWTVGSRHVWLGTCTYPPGFTSNPHSHDDMEETFYCIGGKGQIKVNDTVFNVEIGDAVYCAPGEVHQVINLNGTEDFKVVAVVTPPFTPDSFKKDHSVK
ncbi:MAG: dimethylsulfonioproprionate lyase family protein [Bacillota bacterium]